MYFDRYLRVVPSNGLQFVEVEIAESEPKNFLDIKLNFAYVRLDVRFQLDAKHMSMLNSELSEITKIKHAIISDISNTSIISIISIILNILNIFI